MAAAAHGVASATVAPAVAYASSEKPRRLAGARLDEHARAGRARGARTASGTARPCARRRRARGRRRRPRSRCRSPPRPSATIIMRARRRGSGRMGRWPITAIRPARPPRRRHRRGARHRPRDRPAAGRRRRDASACSPAASSTCARPAAAPTRSALRAVRDAPATSATARPSSAPCRGGRGGQRPGARARRQQRHRRAQRGRPRRPLRRSRRDEPGRHLPLRCAPRSAHLAPGPEPRHARRDRLDPGAHRRPRATRATAPRRPACSASCARSPPSSRATASQVNAICPGWVDTNMAWEGIDGIAEAMGRTREQAFARGHARGADAGAWASPRTSPAPSPGCSRDDARGVTGQAIDHNGGAFMA